MKVIIESIKIKKEIDTNADTSFLGEYTDTMEINNGDIYFLGITAEATVKYKNNDGSFRLETLTSGGLWGIESDSGDYLKEVAKEQLEDLKGHLQQFNISIRNFNRLAKEALEDFND